MMDSSIPDIVVLYPGLADWIEAGNHADLDTLTAAFAAVGDTQPETFAGASARRDGHVLVHRYAGALSAQEVQDLVLTTPLMQAAATIQEAWAGMSDMATALAALPASDRGGPIGAVLVAQDRTIRALAALMIP